MSKPKKYNWEAYRNLEKFNFDVYISKKKQRVDISNRNFGAVIGVLLISIGLSSIIFSFVYLMLIDSISIGKITFKPIIHQLMIACGILLPLIGLSIKSKNKYVKIIIDIPHRRLDTSTFDHGKKTIENIKIPVDFIFSVEDNPESSLVKYNDTNHSITLFNIKHKRGTQSNDITNKLAIQLNNTFANTL
jgi:hypothetical protein